MSTQLLWGDPAVSSDTELTIGIPSYRRTRTLREAIDSVLALPCDKVKFKLLISEDDTENHEEIKRIIESYADPRIVYYHNTPALGMAGNWNNCIFLSRTKYVALLHDDDMLKPCYTDVVDRIIHHSSVPFDVVSFNHDNLEGENLGVRPDAGTGGGSLYDKLQQNRFRRYTPGDYYFGALQLLLLPSCGTLFDREKMVAWGGYSEQDGNTTDEIFFERYCHEHGAYYLRRNVAVYRTSGDRLSLTRPVKISFVTEGVAHRLEMGGVFRFWNRVFGEAGLKWAIAYPWHDALFPEQKLPRSAAYRGRLYKAVRKVYLFLRALRVGLFAKKLP